MTTAPTWQAPTSGQPPLADHINQLLGAHTASIVYNGVQTDGHTTSAGTTVSTNGLWLAQSFVTAVGQTSIGHISFSLTTTTTTGSLLSPTTLTINTNNAGAPSTTVLITVPVTAEYAYNASGGGVSTTRINFPVPVSGLTPSTTYWIVVAAAGNVSNNYTIHQSNQVSGASTSPDGITWTAQAYGFTYTVRDQTVAGIPMETWEDNGARWTVALYDTSSRITQYHEYTAGQTAAGYIQSDRTISYSTWLPTSIA